MLKFAFRSTLQEVLLAFLENEDTFSLAEFEGAKRNGAAAMEA